MPRADHASLPPSAPPSAAVSTRGAGRLTAGGVGGLARLAAGLAMGLAVSGLTLAAATVPAHAHAQLLETDPPDGSLLDALPETVVLTYNEDIAPQYVDAAALPPGDEPVALATSTAEGRVSVTLAGAVAPEPGSWQVVVRVVSVDGHPVESTVGFEVAGGTGDAGVTRPSTGSAPAPTTGEPAVVESPADAGEDLGLDPAAAASTPEELDATGTLGRGWLALAAVAAAAVSVAVVVGLLRSRGRILGERTTGDAETRDGDGSGDGPGDGPGDRHGDGDG